MKYVEPLKDGLKSIPCAILRASARFSLAAKFDIFFSRTKWDERRALILAGLFVVSIHNAMGFEQWPSQLDHQNILLCPGDD